MLDAKKLIATLGLEPHPAGGHFKEVFRSPLLVRGTASSARNAPVRSASTAIYFLLQVSEFSAFHRVSSDEVWHHYLGNAVALDVIHEAGHHERVLLGPGITEGQQPFCAVPAGAWQAARPEAGEPGFSLCGRTAAPGFDFADFEPSPQDELLRRFPEHRQLLEARAVR